MARRACLPGFLPTRPGESLPKYKRFVLDDYLSMHDLEQVYNIQIIIIFLIYYGLLFVFGCVVFYVFRCCFGMLFSFGIQRKYKSDHFYTYEQYYDPHTNSYSTRRVIHTTYEIDHEAETPEFLAEYYRKKEVAFIKASRCAAFFCFCLLIALAFYHGHYMALENFTVSQEYVEQVLKELKILVGKK